MARGIDLAEDAGMMTTTFAYRDALEGARLRHAELRARRTEAQRALDDADRALGRRIARIAAGAMGVAGALAMVGAVIYSNTAEQHGARPWLGAPTTVLLGAWPAMAVAYAAGRVVDVWRRLVHRIAPAPRARDLHTEIARLEQPLPVAETRTRATNLERASVALPLIAMALLGPLTLHAIVNVCVRHVPLDEFHNWITLSTIIVGHAHLLLAWLGFRFATRLRATADADVRSMWIREGYGAYWRTVLASAIPGALLLLIPPAITGVTAPFIIFPAFWRMAHRVATERALLGGETVPF
ncbi:Hypothetical protein A7982_05673 [Minicystis rosea]|nr:Hypothetical protein A7982_05673 [Minicystis rosea]